ncbi:anti-sigma factor [Sphingosinicella sp. CPCC 101087]|uniref:anti-sigma factor family protein n=1 Tax=Sphingosinicella sp. CPCC 101087 TaxID=2497754 RepID=UPI00101C7F0E|nr:zf-HC2 domain-containing protein [Sphingosinicella sp. CPCC 101087]
MNDMDDARLMAYLDGELAPAERTEVEQALAGDPELRSRLDAQGRLRERLAAHYGPVAEEEVPERFRQMLGGSTDNVVDLADARERRRRPLWQTAAALAATLVIGFFVGRLVTVESGPVALRGAEMVASGGLAEALDTQLASAPSPDAGARIGVTFARTDGSLCRTFEGPALAGLACRADSGWQIVMTTAREGAEAGEYRQAGSTNALVLQTAQDLMAGEPLDAEAERRARDSGWRPIPRAR